MLDQNLKAQLQAYLEKLQMPIELLASLDDSAKSAELQELLQEIAGLSDKIEWRRVDDSPRRPSFRIARTGTAVGVSFAGLPLGHEFTSLVLALLQVGGHPSREAAELLQQVRELPGDYSFETYFSLSCQNCPDVVQALNLMSVLNPGIRHTAIDGALFQREVEERGVLAVPAVFLNGQPFASGRMTLAEIVHKLDDGAATRAAAQLQDQEPFDVLIVGGGPAGAAAAIYAARKGIRTGIVAQRFGGQVQDTLGIENFTSVEYTEGPKLAAAMEAHVRANGVDIMLQQQATALVPAGRPGGLHEIQLESGATLRGRTILLSTGARWRKLGVPGEADYLTKGVAFCPHCDGPLFKGKHVAVIGGGNSGAEAAIDLANLVRHVTLIEFDGKLRADEVLQRKLRSLPNVTILTSAETTEIHGDGARVNGLSWRNRTDGSLQRIDLEGVFVQIGLVPNTEWLQGTVERNRQGEIVTDARGETSVPGVFAAGDCTTVPWKQIIVASGEGAKAALSAFDYLIRLPEEVAIAA